MRFMILAKANKDSEDGVRPTEELFAEMATYHESCNGPACCSIRH